jgi:hypothetical protein
MGIQFIDKHLAQHTVASGLEMRGEINDSAGGAAVLAALLK